MAQQSSKFRSLWELTAGQRRRYLLAAIALTIGIALLYLSPLIVRAAIDGLIQKHPVDRGQEFFTRNVRAISGDSLLGALFVAALCVIVVTALGGAFTYLKGKWAALASESIARQLRDRLYNHLQHVSISYHDKAATGDLVQRCTSDVDTVRLFYASQLVELARCVVLSVLALIIFLNLDWKMTPVALAMLPVVLAFALIFFKRVQNSFKAMDEAEGAMTAVLQENLTGIRVVRAFSRQEFEIDKFEQRNRTHRDLNYKLFWIMAYYWAVSDFLCLAQTALVLMVGGWRVANGAMSVGTLVAFVTLVSMLIWPVRQMGRILSELGKAMVALGRIQEILAEPVESQAEKSAESLPRRAKGEISLRDLSFSHGAKQILHGINLKINAGETVAFLGPSGSGKTTLVNLLLRFYDYTHGSITLDGAELKDLDRKYTRSQFGVVMQEPFLYSKTLRDNIKLALILDDALSAVDTRTETMILDALKRRRGKQTTLVIAHRLSTLMHADKIVVLDHGRIAQMGSHEQLVTEDGLYRRLWQIQGALEEDLTRDLEVGAALAADESRATAAEAAPT